MTDYSKFLSSAAEKMQESAIRRMGTVLASSRDIISFAPGYPAPETFAWEEFRDIVAELLSGRDGSVLQYGPTRGFKPLLGAITDILRAREIAATAEELIVTTGSQQGLDLVSRVLLDPGDVVLVELPTYTGAITAFRNVQAQMIGVPQEQDGIDLAALDATCDRLRREGRRIKMLYLVPNFQNPTGQLVGLQKRQRLLEWAERRDLLILEDDPYRDLYFAGAGETDVRPLKADDRHGRVVYLSSFSKTLAPGYRVAWIAAPAALSSKLEFAKQAEDLLTGSLDQRVIYEACHRGVLDRQVPRLRVYYQEKRDVMEEALRREFGDAIRWIQPRGGFFIWVTMHGGLNAEHMLARAVEHGVIYVAGEAFFVARPEPNTIRLSFSAPSLEKIREGVQRLAQTMRAEIEANSLSRVQA